MSSMIANPPSWLPCMVGGIPYYLKYFEKGLSLPQNIDRIFFSKDAVLKDEYNRLFSSLFTNSDTMKSIIEALSTKLGIRGVVTTESLWSKRGSEDTDGTQIDLIISRNDNVVNMCEIKFYSNEFDVDKEYHLVLDRRKRVLQEMIPKRATVHSTLITIFGIKRSGYFSDFISVISMDDLFA